MADYQPHPQPPNGHKSLCLSSRGFPPCPSLSIEATNGSASLCPFNLQCWRPLPTFLLLPSLAAISACCFWAGADWMNSGFDSPVFLAWLVLWDRCPGKTLPSWQVVQDVQGFVLLGWVLDERAGLFNWIWFRWPIPSTLIDESRYNFQLDLSLIGRPVEDSLC